MSGLLWNLFGICKPKSVDWDNAEKYSRSTTREQDRKINAYKQVDSQIKAEERMNRETDPDKQRRMQLLIDQRVYDFDFLFGPEKIK